MVDKRERDEKFEKEMTDEARRYKSQLREIYSAGDTANILREAAERAHEEGLENMGIIIDEILIEYKNKKETAVEGAKGIIDNGIGQINRESEEEIRGYGRSRLEDIEVIDLDTQTGSGGDGRTRNRRPGGRDSGGRGDNGSGRGGQGGGRGGGSGGRPPYDGGLGILNHDEINMEDYKDSQTSKIGDIRTGDQHHEIHIHYPTAQPSEGRARGEPRARRPPVPTPPVVDPPQPPIIVPPQPPIVPPQPEPEQPPQQPPKKKIWPWIVGGLLAAAGIGYLAAFPGCGAYKNYVANKKAEERCPKLPLFETLTVTNIGAIPGFVQGEFATGEAMLDTTSENGCGYQLAVHSNDRVKYRESMRYWKGEKIKFAPVCQDHNGWRRVNGEAVKVVRLEKDGVHVYDPDCLMVIKPQPINQDFENSFQSRYKKPWKKDSPDFIDIYHDKPKPKIIEETSQKYRGGHKVSKHGAKLAGIDRKEIENIYTSLENLRSDISNRYKELYGKIAWLEGSVDENSKSIESLKKEFAYIDGEINTIMGRLVQPITDEDLKRIDKYIGKLEKALTLEKHLLGTERNVTDFVNGDVDGRLKAIRDARAELHQN